MIKFLRLILLILLNTILCRSIQINNNNNDNILNDCRQYGEHIELGNSYQQNKYVNKNITKLNSSTQFVISYQTSGNHCIYGEDINIILNHDNVQLLHISNYTSPPDHSTVNCAKYGLIPSINNQQELLTYSFFNDPSNAHQIILPALYENNTESYRTCIMNMVQDLQGQDCNLVQLFHYNLSQPYNFFSNRQFEQFISSHVIHVISIFSTYDGDLAPFGSKQYYFNYNFMYQVTLDITEEDSINTILNNFNNSISDAILNRSYRPWFVAFANNSPYNLTNYNNSNNILNPKYTEIYNIINQNNFDVLITSSPNTVNLTVYQGSQNNSVFKLVQLYEYNNLKSKNGLIIIEIPTFSVTPFIVETTINSFKIIQNNEVVILITQN